MMKICEYCGKKYYRPANISMERFEARKYCCRKCSDLAQHKRHAFTDEQLEYLRENYEKYGPAICARKFDLSRSGLYLKVKKYEEKHGPLNKKNIPQIKSINIKEEYSQAWIDCAIILNRMREQTVHGKAGLIGMSQKIKEQHWRIEEKEIKRKYEGGKYL